MNNRRYFSTGSKISWSTKRFSNFAKNFLIAITPTLILLWPIFLNNYILDGPASAEIKMIFGLKRVFNEALLNFEFPLWNQFIECGNVFLLFGSTPFNILTPFEILLNGLDQNASVLALIAISYVTSTSFLMLGFHFIGIPLWLAIPSSIIFFINEPISLLSHFPYVHASNMVTITFLIILFVARKLAPVRYYIPLFWLTFIIYSLGTKPELLQMFLIIICVSLVFEAISSLYHGTSALNTLRIFVNEFVTYIVVPILIYSWQIPQLVSLINTSTHRIQNSVESIQNKLGNVILSFGFSVSFQIVVWLLTMTSIIHVINKFVKPKGAFLKYAILIFGIIGYHYTISIVTSSLFEGSLFILPSYLSITIILYLTYQKAILKRSTSLFFSDNMLFNWKHVIKFSLFIGALNSSLSDTMLLRTGYTPELTIFAFTQKYLNLPLNIFIVFVIINGAGSFFFRNIKEIQNDLISLFTHKLGRLFIICWIIRDIFTLPIFDFLSIMYVNPRDLVFYGSIPAIFFALGFRSVLLDIRRMPKVKAYSVFVLLISFSFLFIYSSSQLFNIQEMQVTSNVTWYYPKMSERKLISENMEFLRQDYHSKKLAENGFIRTITMENTTYGPCGSFSYDNIYDAWGYAFVSDHWLSLSRKAFPQKTSIFPFPRPYPYSLIARKIYDYRNPTLKSIDLWDKYGEWLYPKNGNRSDVNPFYLELMRVGVIWRFNNASLNVNRNIRLAEYKSGLSIFHLVPDKSLRRYGILPKEQYQYLESASFESRDSNDMMRKKYNKVLFNSEDMSVSGYQVLDYKINHNNMQFTISAKNEGYLIIFDSWHPHWRVYKNDKKVNMDRVFENFRSIEISVGLNKIVLEFKPPYFNLFIFISITTILFCLQQYISQRYYRK
ncbi:MAG: hypothetical protein HQK54_01450 [Oligoflexales bacterium]|nr:hypothetical protein [Oligoflexales bacterium]